MQFIWIIQGALQIKISQHGSVIIPNKVVDFLYRITLHVSLIHLNHVVLSVRLQEVHVVLQIYKLRLAPILVHQPFAYVFLWHVNLEHARVLLKFEIV